MQSGKRDADVEGWEGGCRGDTPKGLQMRGYRWGVKAVGGGAAARAAARGRAVAHRFYICNHRFYKAVSGGDATGPNCGKGCNERMDSFWTLVGFATSL